MSLGRAVRWPRGARSPPTAWTRPPPARPPSRRSPPSSTSFARTERFQAFVRTLPDARPGLGAGAAARCSPRSTPSSAARCSCCCPRTPTRGTRPTAPSWFGDAATGRVPPEPRRRRTGPGSSRRRTSSASGSARSTSSRPAGSSARRSRALAEGLPPLAAAPGAARAAGRRRAGHRRARRGARARRVRARRPGRGARPVRRARRHRRRLPVDRARAAPGRALRRRDRAGARVLAVHAARAAPGRAAPSSIRRPSGAPTCVEPTSAGGRRRARRSSSIPADLVPPVDRAPDIVWQPDDVRRVWEEEGLAPLALDGATELDPFPRGAAARVRGAAPRDRRARPRRGRERARRASSASGNRVVVAFAHRGEADAAGGAAAQGRAPSRSTAGEALGAEPGAALRGRPGPPRVRLARARARAAARHAGLPQAARRAPTRGSVGRSRASPTCGSATTSSTRTTASASSSASRRRRSPVSRATTSTSRSAARTGSTSRTSSSGSSRSTSAPTRSRAEPLEARRQGLAEPQGARAGRPCASWPASCCSSTPSASGPRASRTTSPATGSSGSRRRSRTARPTTRQRAIEAVKEDLESPRPDGPARLRRRRLRQDRGRGARGVRRRRQRAAGARALPDDDPRRAALEHLPRALPRLPGARRDGLPLPQARGGEGGADGVRRREGRGARRHAPDPLAGRDPEAARPRHRRRGAALRRRAEGAPARAAARGRRPRALRDADPADAPHVALRAPRHLDHRDAARGPAPDPDDRRRVRRRADPAARSSASTRASGQSFYLHNRVETIDEAAEKLQQLCPGLRFLVAHGQMAERELEERMHAFLARRRRRARLDDDHRVRASTSRRRTRSSSSGPTRSGSRSCTRSAGASAAPT